MKNETTRRPAIATAIEGVAIKDPFAGLHSSPPVVPEKGTRRVFRIGEAVIGETVQKPKAAAVRVKPTQAEPVKVAKPRGRPPTNPVRVKPTITSADVLPPERLIQPTSARPLIWKDLPLFASRHERSSMEMMFDLGFNTTYQYTNAANKSEVLPFDLELLVRILEVYPSSAPWKKTQPSQALDLIYGDVMERYQRSADEDAAIRMVLGHRLAAILDRSVTVLYRWLTDSGASSRRVINILSKVEEMGSTPPERRAAFENIALPAWRLRGIDIEQMFKLSPNMVLSRHMNQEVRQRLLGAKQPAVFEAGQAGSGSFM